MKYYNTFIHIKRSVHDASFMSRLLIINNHASRKKFIRGSASNQVKTLYKTYFIKTQWTAFKTVNKSLLKCREQLQVGLQVKTLQTRL